MLSKENNDVLCRVGPGTPMGNLMRQYWIPAATSAELAAREGAPLRVRLLGENLIAFRTASGELGMLEQTCPHRGASLFYGKNEADGLRCVYHGWKFGVNGACLEMPSETSEHCFKQKVKATAYPCVERGGVIWTYMGPRHTPPPLPDLEANMDPQSYVVMVQRRCNYMQALEGDIDTVHFAFLHIGHMTLENTHEGSFPRYQVLQRAPRYTVIDTDYGTCYGAYRSTENDDTLYWRIGNALMPFYTQVPLGPLAVNRSARAWVPMDDEHTMVFTMVAPPAGGYNPAEPDAPSRGVGEAEMLPDSSDWYGRSRLKAAHENDYLLDREAIGRGESYSGLPGLVVEDTVVTETMGPIYDRTQEHLGTGDIMIIRTRQRFIKAAEALRDRGEIPPGVDNPAVYRQRTGGVMLPRGVDWLEGTRELRKAFVTHPPEVVRETISARRT
jgi:phthalate 4,5-dioxygenase oxygenase subunit